MIFLFIGSPNRPLEAELAPFKDWEEIGGDLFGDGGDLLGDGGNLLVDGGDLLGDGGDLLGDGGDLHNHHHHNHNHHHHNQYSRSPLPHLPAALSGYFQ